jgi:hypothetical protein
MSMSDGMMQMRELTEGHVKVLQRLPAARVLPNSASFGGPKSRITWMSACGGKADVEWCCEESLAAALRRG